jgi:hypothetical protein
MLKSMKHYRAIFLISGGEELKADRGYVPDAFFDAAQHVTPEDVVAVYEGGFVLSNEMHEKLDKSGTFSSYAVVGFTAPEGADKKPEFVPEMIQRMKLSNHARPIADNIHYQVFFMEHIESPPDDD